MDKAQKSLIDTYYRKRAIAVSQNRRYKYLPYEYSKYALENKIMDFSKLSIGDVYEIYTTNPKVQQYIKPIIDNYNKESTGLLKILLNYENSDNYNELESFIINSDFYKENGKEIYFHNDYFTIRVDKDKILDVLNLGDNYENVVSTANGHYGNGYADSSELDYMQGSLSDSNMSKIIKIAKMMGADDETISGFNDEGNLSDFLNKHKLDEINDIYLSEYGDTLENANVAAANEQLETFPLKINNYENIVSTANGHYGNGYTDSSELDYMQRSLSDSNMSKIIKIAKMMGADDETISGFNDEGNLSDFLNEHKLDEINDIYLSEYGDALENANVAAANEQLETFPLEINNDETKFYIDELLSYIYQYNLKNISTFDQFLENLKSSNDINYDNIYETAYNHMDLTQLNQVIDDRLDDIINGFNDPDSGYYELIKGYKELQEYISKYKFTPINKNGIIATYKQQDKTINITEFKYDENEEDENKKLKFKISFIYNGGKTPFERSGWIFASNLSNYIKQQEIKIMREAIQIS